MQKQPVDWIAVAILSLGLVLSAGMAAASGVGFREVRITNADGHPLDLAIWYPSDSPASLQAFGPFRQLVSKDGAIEGHDLPLVIMSHGSGGAPWNHYDTALALAAAGFVVAAPTHPGDNTADRKRPSAILYRPQHLSDTLDFMVSIWGNWQAIDFHRIGFFGFSAGGFAGLVLLGGGPEFARLVPHCQSNPGEFACVTAEPLLADGRLLNKAPTRHLRDERIKAAVIAAPALGFLLPRETLDLVSAPVQLWRAEDDAITPHPWHAEAIRQSLPVSPDYRVVPKAGHFDFIAPCNPRLAAAAAFLCRSAPGFDRAAFHGEFNREVVAFFTRHLKVAR